MREILFRAKRIDNEEWVEGSYLYCKKATTVSFRNEHYILVFDGYGVAYHEIDKDTICQYTGLTDKNGNKIWENDIIRFNDGKECVVRWRFGAFEFLYRACANAIYAYVGTDLYLDENTLDIEVIGNIFDEGSKLLYGK